MSQTAERTPRDVRIDQIGLFGEIKSHVDNLKTCVKQRMMDDTVVRVAGDFFAGVLNTKSETPIDGSKFLRLFETGKISRDEFLAAVSIKKDPVNRLLAQNRITQKQFKAVCCSPSDPAHSLSLTRITGAKLTLVDAVGRLRETVA